MTFPYPWSKDPGKTRRFLAQGAAIWQSYDIPLGANFLEILVGGGGGAGGNGFSAAAAAARGGGAGGGAGAITRLLIPTVFLPPTIQCLVGLGGAATAGGDSYVALQQSNIAATMLARAAGGSVGGNGSGATGGNAGVAGVITALANQGPYSALGQYVSIAGAAGVSGGSQLGGIGNAATFGSAGVFVTGGAGGGGTTSADFAGGNITGAGRCPTILGGLAGSNAGNGGFENLLPPTFSGGSGGGSSNTGIGGAGGAAGPGSGGGGGGGGTTGGIGGRGGNGFIFITALY